MESFEPFRSVFFSAEDGKADTFRPRLEALGANAKLVYAHDLPLYLDTPEGLAELERERSMGDRRAWSWLCSRSSADQAGVTNRCLCTGASRCCSMPDIRLRPVSMERDPLGERDCPSG